MEKINASGRGMSKDECQSELNDLGHLPPAGPRTFWRMEWLRARLAWLLGRGSQEDEQYAWDQYQDARGGKKD